jgi:iron(III) transport system permease protein
MQHAFRTICGGVVVLLFLLPVALVWLPSSTATDELLTSPPIPWATLVRSVCVAGATALLALAIGAALAFLFAATDFPVSAFWGTLVLVPFVCPSTAWALADVYCYGPGGVVERMLGDGLRPVIEQFNRGHYLSTVMVLAQIYAPIVMLFLWRGVGRLHHAGLEAAFLFLSPSRRLMWLVRTLRRELIGSASLVFAMALGNFAVPHVLQCRLYIIDVYMRAANYLDHDGAVLAVLPLVLLALAAIACVIWLDVRSPSMRGDVSEHWRVPLGTSRWAIGGLLTVYVVLTIGLPIGAMIWECRSVADFFKTAQDAAPEISNTIILGAVVAITAVVVGLGTCVVPSGKLRSACRCVAFVTIGLPPLVVALSYTRLYSYAEIPGLETARRAGAIVAVALAFQSWPFVARLIVSADRLASPAWREAADLGRLSATKRWRWITLPWSCDYLFSGAIIAYVIATSDIVICQMLCEPGQGTLSLRLFTFLHFGPTHVAASLALLQLLVTCLPVFVYFLVADRCLRVV